MSLARQDPRGPPTCRYLRALRINDACALLGEMLLLRERGQVGASELLELHPVLRRHALRGERHRCEMPEAVADGSFSSASGRGGAQDAEELGVIENVAHLRGRGEEAGPAPMDALAHVFEALPSARLFFLGDDILAVV